MRRRILFYSHDSYGLGHFRRSLTIASYLSRHLPDLSILMLTGIEAAASFEAPKGIDFVKLPAIWKSGPDEYRSRHLRVGFARVRRMRETLIRALARIFDASLFIVDNVPLGVDGELLPTLRYLRKHHPRTRVVLTLRDVLDAPEHIVPRWREQGIYGVLKRFYDEIWVAGCQAVFDPVALYELPPPVAAKVRFCGYLVRSSEAGHAELVREEFGLDGRPLVVVSCGGGGDGYPLIRTYVDAVDPLVRDGVRSAIFLGPDMTAAQRRELKRRILPRREHFLTFDFNPSLVAFLELAAASVSMAGYNTVCEVIALRKPALVVPRIYPRVEQLLRANAFAAHGLLQVLHPDQLDPNAMRTALGTLLNTRPGWPAAELPTGMDFAGLHRVARRVGKLLGSADARSTSHDP
ncbi:MAG: glycosyltransferase family protein [Candidatus Binatia bacterium]